MSTSTLSTVFSLDIYTTAVFDYILMLGVVVLVLLSVWVLSRKFLK